MGDPVFDEWVERARNVDILSVAQKLGARLKKMGVAEHGGPCPLCAGVDRFNVNVKERVFLCRGSGDGGDAISMVRHVRGCSFVDACTYILDEAPPGAGDDESRSFEPDPDVLRERARERRDEEAERDRQEAQKRLTVIDSASSLFERSAPIAGSWAERYLAARHINLKTSQAADFGFISDLPYRGYADAKASEEAQLGSFPCMVAAIRDIGGAIIGIHRTYLDPDTPIKLKPPGDRSRNKAKKIFGQVQGGLIRIGEIGETLAVGEGIETVLAWYSLGLGPEDITIAAAGALGNIFGGALGSTPHPTRKRPGGKPSMMPNGEPSPDKPGMILPRHVSTLYLIGDGDSDRFETGRKLLTAGRRYRQQGIEVFLSMAPDGMDFADVVADQISADGASREAAE